MKAEAQSNAPWRRLVPSLHCGLGLGLLVMLADTNAGNVVATAQSGAQ
jgi:Mn2+/Fe2+ NRAMP family transporter